MLPIGATTWAPNFGDPSRPSASKTDTEWAKEASREGKYTYVEYARFADDLGWYESYGAHPPWAKALDPAPDLLICSHSAPPWAAPLTTQRAIDQARPGFFRVILTRRLPYLPRSSWTLRGPRAL